MTLISKLRTLLFCTWKDFKYNKKHMKIRFSSNPEKDFSDLRMYCHMLDKGLNNGAFEPGHSLNIFKKAKELSIRLHPYFGEDKEFQWIEGIIKSFEEAQKTGSPSLVNNSAYEYSSQEINDLTKFIKRRTSCRNFQDKKIQDEIIQKIIDIAVDAPNSCCRQSVRYYFSQDKDLIKEISPKIAGLTNFTNVQCLVCVAAETSYYDLIDKNLRFIDASLSAENFLLGASLYGIYGTICNSFHANKSEKAFCKNKLNVKDTEDIIFFMAIGYPTVIPQKPVRRTLSVFYKQV